MLNAMNSKTDWDYGDCMNCTLQAIIHCMDGLRTLNFDNNKDLPYMIYKIICQMAAYRNAS